MVGRTVALLIAGLAELASAIQLEKGIAFPDPEHPHPHDDNIDAEESDDAAWPGLHDPYAKFEGHLLLKVTACSKEAQARAVVLLKRGCQTMDEWGLFTRKDNSSCASEVAICRPEEAALLSAAHDTQTLSQDAGGTLRGKSGLAKMYHGNQHAVLDSEGGAKRDAFYDDWRDYDGLLTRLHEIASSSNGLAVIDELFPKTIEGRNIQALRMRGRHWEYGKPRVLITCQLHAREWLAGMCCMKVAEEITSWAKETPDYFRNLEIVIIPVANPDGFVYSTKENRYWRKNMRDNGKPDCRGVDLNRNWNVDWNGGQSTSENFCEEIFVGASPRSEPENEVLYRMMHEAPMSVHLDIHTFSGLVLGPWDHTKKPYPKADIANALGKRLMNALNSVNDIGFIYGTAEALYLASGAITDFSISGFPEQTNDTMAYTIELRPTKKQHADYIGLVGFSPDPKEILPQAAELMAAVKVGIRYAKDPSNVLHRSNV